MSPQASLIAQILKIPETQGAIRAALDEEANQILPTLRTAVVMGDPIKAALAEGRLQALDDVLGVLTRFAEKAKSHQE